MPDITVRGTFKPDPSYNHVEEVERSIQMMRKYLDNQLSIIDNIGDQTMQLICMFSLIDCLAQEWAGYPTGSPKKHFVNLCYNIKANMIIWMVSSQSRCITMLKI